MIFLASYLHDNRQILVTAGRRVLGFTIPPMKQFGPMLIVWGAAMATLLLTRELGTSLMFYGAFLALLYVATGRFSFPFIGLVLFVVGGCFVGRPRQPRARARARLGRTVQPGALQTLGRGLLPARPVAVRAGRRRPARHRLRPLAAAEVHGNSILPVPESDMIYAVIVNELGLAGAIALLLVYLLLVARGLSIAVMARDSFSKLLATGLSFVLALQVFVIVGGVTRVIPLTGVTLPFVAYGGSSVVMNFVLVALLLVISDRARRPQSGLPAHLTARRARRRGRPPGGAARAGDAAAPSKSSHLTMRVTRNPGGWEATLARLRRALEDDLFVLHFQPIVSLSDRTVARHEALLRLADREDGRLVAPNEFLPAAERQRADRRDRPLGARAGDLAAGRTRRRRARAPAGWPPTSRRCRSATARLAGELERMFDRHGVEPSMLVLELTETAADPRPRPRPLLLRRDARARLRDRARRLRGRLRRPAPAAGAALQLSEDRRRVRPPAAHLARRPSDRGRPQGALAGNGQPDGGRVRRPTAARSRSCSDIGVELAQGFELGRPAPLLAAAA